MSTEGTRIIGNLPPGARRIVQAPAALGLPLMSLDELAAAAGMPATDVQTTVAALVVAGQLTPRRPRWYALATTHQAPTSDRDEFQDIRCRFAEYLLRHVRAQRIQVTQANKAVPKERPHHDGSPTAASPLSQREHEVLELIADGLENQSIAKILFISVETVRTHVKSILRKLPASDRTHAVAIAFRTRLLAVTPAATLRSDHRWPQGTSKVLIDHDEGAALQPDVVGDGRE